MNPKHIKSSKVVAIMHSIKSIQYTLTQNAASLMSAALDTVEKKPRGSKAKLTIDLGELEDCIVISMALH
jgi:hypothetical protein